VVRELWPEHRVTRADVAEDFAAEGAYEALERACRSVYREMGVKGRAIVPDDPRDGRTYYGGAASSDVRVRLYDKTAEARRFLPEARHDEVPDHWARLEVQVRPRKGVKDLACRMEPAQFWGCARWTASLASAAMQLEVERIRMNPARESDHDRAYRFLLEQYGRTFARLLEDHGSPAAVGAQIYEDLRHMGLKK
jgi:DNA relaxase NicK